MCTLVARFAPNGARPLILAANRDERLSRPAGPPRIWHPEGGEAFLAPEDEEAHGSWLGLNANGLFVGVTNRFGEARRPERASRGKLVTESLEAPSASELHRRLAALSPETYNAFHLFYADRKDAFVTWSNGNAIRQETLGPGLHVITERSLGGDDRARTEAVRARWGTAFGTDPLDPLEESTLVEKLGDLMRGHAPEPLTGPCVHVPELGYGTRSSTLVLLGRGPEEVRFFWAGGRPCEAPFRDLAPLVHQLRAERAGDSRS